MEEPIEVNFDQAIKKMSKLPLKLEKLLSKGNQGKQSHAKAWGHFTKWGQTTRAFPEVDLLFEPWIVEGSAR